MRGPAAAARGGSPTFDAWKAFSDHLSSAAPKVRAAKVTLGVHNHDIECKPVERTRPIDLLIANRDITSFQLNIALCLKGGELIDFLKRCPRPVQSLLSRDYNRYARWKEVFAAAEGKAGLQFYLSQRTDRLFLVERQDKQPVGVGREGSIFASFTAKEKS